MEETVNTPQISPQENSASKAGAIPDQLKKEELETALKETILDLTDLCQNNVYQIFLLAITNIVLLAGAYCFGKTLYENTDFEKYWDLRIIYYTATRLLLASAYLSLVVFTLNLLRSYLKISKMNRDKLMIARSMAGLLAAGSGFIERNVVYNKLLDIIVSDSSKSNIVEKDESMKLQSYDALLDLLKEALKKK